MDKLIKSLIEKELKEAVILDNPNFGYPNVKIFGYPNVKIVDFRTKYNDGGYFVHKDGNKYAIAFLNAFTKKGFEIIKKATKAYPEVTLEEIKKIISENRLKEYVHGNTKKYLEWQTGDEGTAFIEYEPEIGDYKVAGFTNITAEGRKFN